MITPLFIFEPSGCCRWFISVQSELSGEIENLLENPFASVPNQLPPQNAGAERSSTSSSQSVCVLSDDGRVNRQTVIHEPKSLI